MKLARLIIAVLLTLTATGYSAYRLWPRNLLIRPIPLTPVLDTSGARAVVTMPGRFLIAEIARYDDELFAYLMSTYLRARPVFRRTEVLLTYRKLPTGISYQIQVHVENDLLSATFLIGEARKNGLVQEISLRHVPLQTLQRLRYENGVFHAAYSLPARRRLEHLLKADLNAYVRRFVRFKALTDPRTRRKLEPIPALTSVEAKQLAADTRGCFPAPFAARTSS